MCHGRGLARSYILKCVIKNFICKIEGIKTININRSILKDVCYISAKHILCLRTEMKMKLHFNFMKVKNDPIFFL